jgi:predicted dehydrogenase
MIRVALLSKWHVHAVDYAREAAENPNVEIVKVWDEEPERGQTWADELHVPFEKDLTEVFNDKNIDAVILTSATDRHKEILTQAARHGKHIFTEKVLSFTQRDNTEILRHIDEANVKFMISLPRLTSDYYLFAQRMMDEKTLGTVNMIRCRVAHNGAVPTDDHPQGWLPDRFFNKEQCGGGTLIDLGAHPIYLANRLAGGQPKAVSARLHSLMELGVDDHAVATVEYESGILATLESSFLSSGSPFQLELYGTEGTLMIEGDQVRVKSTTHGLNEWTHPELPPPLLSPLDQWVEDILDRSTPTITQTDAKALTLVNEAASLSHQKGKRIEIDE